MLYLLDRTEKKIVSVVNQSGIEPLNLENGSSGSSGNFDATDLRFQFVELKLNPTGIVKKFAKRNG